MQEIDVQKLIEDNIALVYYIISKQYPTFIKDEDVIQSGMVGLCKAANYYDPEKGLFSSYAGRCIRNEINEEFIRRKPTKNNVSLDTKLGEDGTLSDVLVGDDDVAYIDESFFSQLTKDEATLLNLESAGYTTDEISELCGFNAQKVRKILRIIHLKRRKFFDEHSY